LDKKRNKKVIEICIKFGTVFCSIFGPGACYVRNVRSTPLPWTPPFRASPHLNVITRTSLFPLPGLARNGKSEIGAGARRSFLDPFWPFLAQNGFTLGRFGAHLGHLGPTLGPYFGSFVPFGAHFGTLWGPRWLLLEMWSKFGSLLDLFWTIFAHFLETFFYVFSDIVFGRISTRIWVIF